MKVIGMTGGVGAGKSQILSYIKQKYNSRIIMADEVAHLVKEPGQACYEKLIVLLGKEILEADGQIHRGKMAEKIFADKELLYQVNAIIHPAVKEYITEAIAHERKDQKLDFLFIEAALLIEGGYGAVVDEMWYLYTAEEIRRERLKEARNYSDEKIDQILKSQLSDEEFRSACSVTIDNSGMLEQTYQQIDKKLEEYLWNKEKNMQNV
ncbi:MAG: dephospho-CoA kinase [Lachnospiraceae bacterium]|nr:dephospho-CoA kinase [Lachnospiraceae bacterium]